MDEEITKDNQEVTPSELLEDTSKSLSEELQNITDEIDSNLFGEKSEEPANDDLNKPEEQNVEDSNKKEDIVEETISKTEDTVDEVSMLSTDKNEEKDSNEDIGKIDEITDSDKIDKNDENLTDKKDENLTDKKDEDLTDKNELDITDKMNEEDSSDKVNNENSNDKLNDENSNDKANETEIADIVKESPEIEKNNETNVGIEKNIDAESEEVEKSSIIESHETEKSNETEVEPQVETVEDDNSNTPSKQDKNVNDEADTEPMEVDDSSKATIELENEQSLEDKQKLDDTIDEKDKDEESTTNIEYVELGNSLEENENDKEDDVLQCNSLANTSQESQEENPLQVDKEGGEKESNEIEEDAIAEDLITDNPEGADEELCIIPDTERVISQEEKEAAFSIPPLRDISVASTSNDSSQDSEPTPDSSAVSHEYKISLCDIEDLQSCKECVLKRKVKYSVAQRSSNEVLYICNDSCLEAFKKANDQNYILNWEQLRVRNLTDDTQMNFERICKSCNAKINSDESNLAWELMDFCNEFCLWRYQKKVGSKCASCKIDVSPNSLGKYCVRFGQDVRQFCSSICLEDFKKGIKVCSYCQQDMSKHGEGFLAPVGDKGQFKDFCSHQCVEKYDIMTNNKPPKVDENTKCSVCKTDNEITIEFEANNIQNYFCSDRCFVAFSFVNNITSSKCSMCRRYCSLENLQKRTAFFDNVQYSFCSNSCQNIYILAHRKIVPCAWCKVKKYNFDMIRKYLRNGQTLNMCSINCFNLFQVSINAVHSKKTVCNFCNKCHQPMYHLTMSDASIRNFCSYNCVMAFQNKFKKSPITIHNQEEQTYPVPTGLPRKSRKVTVSDASTIAKDATPPLPVISSVQSLATKNGNFSSNQQNQGRHSKKATGTPQPILLNTTQTEPQIKIKHHIIIKPAPVPDQRNVATMCKIRCLNKGTTCKPTTADKEIQTDTQEAEKVLIPVPVPTYVPSPLPMFSVPVPYPLPIPVPIPVPIFIPTTRNSAKGIMKEIKKIQVKIPTDPYEAELLMMAEMVAGDKKEEHTDSESEVEEGTGADESHFSPEPVDASNTFGDDMLQMALKMATELEEPAVDLEGALTANTITAPQGSESNSEEVVDDPQPMLPIAERQSCRGRKRGSGSRGGKTPLSVKKRRLTQSVDSCEQNISNPPVVPQEPAEKPDAHLCLKYTFGVNAWKQWVTTKNQAELEKTSKYIKPFKTEILQLTADELNYSLCLFVKEVRKPNGAEYAPDTIYYLCLGIQQYLFENGRIDNIFCDPYYEQFTDSLDEVARKFSVLYNDSHYIVTRVEEEHLWESKQLGAHSPHVLLSTLMFFNTKHFNLTTVQEHMQLSFSHIMKHWKRNPNQAGVSRTPGSRNVLLRFYPPQAAMQNNSRKKKVYEQQENDENPLRCPVKLYEFYLSKCPESVKTRNDVFYLQPERSCVPDSPVWYSTTALPQEALEKMLHRVKMVKEINVALLTS